MVLKLKGEIEDPAFHLFVDEEQGRRDESNRLSVFHLMELYKVKEGKTDLLNAEIIDNLMNQGLVVAEHDTLRLCDAYQKKKEVMNTPQSRWEVFNQQLGVRLGVNDIIKESFKGKDIENQIDTLNKRIKEKLGVNTPNPLKKKLGVNRYSIILLLYFFPNMTFVRLAELTELSSTTIEKNVAWLKEHGLIAREGSDKNGTWRVIL